MGFGVRLLLNLGEGNLLNSRKVKMGVAVFKEGAEGVVY